MTVFDVVTDVIGLNNSMDLMEKCGGMIFYIPKNPLYYRKLRFRIQHLKSIGWSENDIVLELSHEFDRSQKHMKNTFKKIEKGLFDD